MPSHRSKGVTVLVFFLLVFVAAAYFINDHSQFEEFKADRAAWRQKCDRYVDAKVPPSERRAAQECQRELDALMARGRAHGWIK